MSKICSDLHHVLDHLTHYQYPFDEFDLTLNGIYFLFEKGEEAHGTNRIVRVGSHTGQNNLISRLTEHYIKENKDRSIFRKNIGRAYLNESQDSFLKKWEIDLTKRKARNLLEHTVDLAYQRKIEIKVTEIIRKNFSFVVIPINKYQDRHYFESKAIATISLCSECLPSNQWLGLSSPVKKIRDSGLWNVQHLYKEPLSEEDIERMKKITNY